MSVATLQTLRFLPRCTSSMPNVRQIGCCLGTKADTQFLFLQQFKHAGTVLMYKPGMPQALLSTRAAALIHRDEIQASSWKRTERKKKILIVKLLGEDEDSFSYKDIKYSWISATNCVETLRTLLDIDFPPWQITWNLPVLRLEPDLVQERVNKLKELGCEPVSVGMVTNMADKSDEEIQALHRLHSKLILKFSNLNMQEVILKIFDLSPEDYTAVSRCVKFGRFFQFLEMLENIFEAGFTPDDCLEDMSILRQSLKYWQVLCELIKQNPHTCVSVKELYGKTRCVHYARLPKYIEGIYTGSSKKRALMLARLLRVDQEAVNKNMSSCWREKIENLPKKVALLLEYGYSSKEILYNDFLLRTLTLSEIKEAVKCIKNDEKLAMLPSVIRRNSSKHYRHIPERQNIRTRCNVLKDLLGLDEEDIYSTDESGTYEALTHIDGHTLTVNMQYLLQEGYTVEEIRRCAYLLGHDTGLVKTYHVKLQSYVKHGEMAQIATDKLKFLNVLQYMIETDHHWEPIVNQQLLSTAGTDDSSSVTAVSSDIRDSAVVCVEDV